MKQKSALYLGIDPKCFKTLKPIIHMPLVVIKPRPVDSIEVRRVFSEILNYTHIIFTCKSSAKIFLNYLGQFGYGTNALDHIHVISIGQLTAQFLSDVAITPTYITTDETQEGIIRTLMHLDLVDANILLPRSSSARPLLSHFMVEHDIRHHICTLYDMQKRRPHEIPDLSNIDEVVFTTPLAVDSFFELYKHVPKEIRLHPIGPMARERLRHFLHVHHSSSKADRLKEKTTAYAC